MGVDGSVVPCHPTCSPPYFFFRDGTTERSWRRMWRKEEGDVENSVCVCGGGGKKIEPGLTLLRHKLQLAHTMWRWEIIEASPILNLRQLFTLAFTNTHPCAVRVQVFKISPFKCKGIMEARDERARVVLILRSSFFYLRLSVFLFFLLWECIVLLQIITIKKPLIPHSVKLIELRKKCNDSN